MYSRLQWLPVFDLIKLRKLVLLFTILNNPDAPLCLKRKFNFLSSVRSTGLQTRACAFNLQVPYPRSNSGKRTFCKTIFWGYKLIPKWKYLYRIRNVNESSSIAISIYFNYYCHWVECFELLYKYVLLECTGLSKAICFSLIRFGLSL